MEAAPSTVHVVDDDPSFRKSLSRLLLAAGYDVRTYDSVTGFLESDPGANPGCVVADLRMPGLSGLDLQERLATAGTPLPVVFLTAHGDIPTTVRAIQKGAVDFLTKPASRENLIAAVERALGDAAAARQQQSATLDLRKRFGRLTQRERDVLPQVIAGKLNKQIASDLGVGERTIKLHRANLLRKMGAASLPDLVRLAQALGIQPVPPR